MKWIIIIGVIVFISFLAGCIYMAVDLNDDEF